MPRSRRLTLASLVFASLLITQASLPTSAHQATPSVATPTATGPAVSVVAAGLTNPRGFTFSPTGDLIVALGGVPGNSGVVRVANGCPTPIVIGLPAYQIVFGALTGVADVAYLNGQLYALLSGGNLDRGGRPNGLYRLGDDGSMELVANISAFIRDNPVAHKPGDYDADGQPYAMLAAGDAFWVTEGNSDQLLRVGLDGSITRVVDLSAGHPIPTGLAPGPDGGVYVGFLTPAPYTEGAAKVVHVAPDGSVTDVWTGLTLITALAVGPDGALYALEMASGYGDDPHAIAPGSGRVVRMTEANKDEPVVTGLTLPSAMEFGPDGALYIGGPTFGADQGQGTIVRVDLSSGQSIAIGENLATPPPCA